MKKKIIKEVTAALHGLFDVKLQIDTGGLTIGEASIGRNGLSLGNYSASSTKLFPATVDMDNVPVSCRMFTCLSFHSSA